MAPPNQISIFALPQGETNAATILYGNDGLAVTDSSNPAIVFPGSGEAILGEVFPRSGIGSLWFGCGTHRSQVHREGLGWPSKAARSSDPGVARVLGVCRPRKGPALASGLFSTSRAPMLMPTDRGATKSCNPSRTGEPPT